MAFLTVTGEQAGMLRHLRERYVRTATKELSRYGRSRCEQIVAFDSCVAGYTETKGSVFPMLNLVPAVVSGMCFDDRSSHISLFTRAMLFAFHPPFSRDNFHARASIDRFHHDIFGCQMELAIGSFPVCGHLLVHDDIC